MWEWAERTVNEFFPECQFTRLPSKIGKNGWEIKSCRVDCGNVIFECDFLNAKMFYRFIRSVYRFNKV